MIMTMPVTCAVPMTVETLVSAKTRSIAMGTAQVTGIVMIIAERLGLPVTLHTPTEVKAAVSGSGRADKAQVTTMVTRLLGLDRAPKPADAADALALAVCHIWRPAGALGTPQRAPGSMTAAQRAWASAEQAARRRG